MATLSFEVPANTGTESSPDSDTYYLYVWLDKNYEHTNEGTVNTDPMQGLSFTMQWKNATMIQNGA